MAIRPPTRVNRQHLSYGTTFVDTRGIACWSAWGILRLRSEWQRSGFGDFRPDLRRTHSRG